MAVVGLAVVYTQAAEVYIQQIRQYSLPAAGCLEQIRIQYGSYAAFLAAFALVVLRERRNRLHSLSSSEALKAFTYYEEMRDTDEAIQLYREAATYLLTA